MRVLTMEQDITRVAREPDTIREPRRRDEVEGLVVGALSGPFRS
jgi:hypothetical protein